MSIEVEQKFRVADRQALERRLRELGAKQLDAVEQVDCYYAHPVRDFAQTDEAFRIRRVGEANYFTYKGPKLDITTKSRREIEVPLAPGPAAAADASQLVLALGFRRVAEVRKQRRHCTLRWQDREIDVALDEVAGLGTFVELEIVTDEKGLDAARDGIASLARQLALSESERRSYLELLLQQQSAPGPGD